MHQARRARGDARAARASGRRRTVATPAGRPWQRATMNGVNDSVVTPSAVETVAANAPKRRSSVMATSFMGALPRAGDSRTDSGSDSRSRMRSPGSLPASARRSCSSPTRSSGGSAWNGSTTTTAEPPSSTRWASRESNRRRVSRSSGAHQPAKWGSRATSSVSGECASPTTTTGLSAGGEPSATDSTTAIAVEVTSSPSAPETVHVVPDFHSRQTGSPDDDVPKATTGGEVSAPPTTAAPRASPSVGMGVDR